MAFLKRLGFYLIGLSIGIVFLTLFLKKKSEETGTEFCYFPNCRVLKDLRSKPITFSDQVNQQLKAKDIDTLDITLFLKNGDVDFGRSDTKAKPCKIYWIEGDLKGDRQTLKFKNCSNKVVLDEIPN
ncbi:DUF4258 domain-containing protein [Pseudozobellia thermophila]|uniref:DUF4258 domain-containing protein n=1 Tax=Pseudozobellia thermophila TaxID=192903 RepID=A0A1M6EXI1_9FLAO|nr:DUF4258 domain-containing protein [Pseudozobellia thermophila]SHI90152.1 hypothetical protein SAMN04488513_102216 [Pseudozobellia thermophila]